MKLINIYEGDIKRRVKFRLLCKEINLLTGECLDWSAYSGEMPRLVRATFSNGRIFKVYDWPITTGYDYMSIEQPYIAQRR